MTKTKVTTNATNKWKMAVNPDNEKNAYKKIEMPTGWICPLCGRALSPWTSCCPCRVGAYQPSIPTNPIVNPPYTFDEEVLSTTYSTMQPIKPQDIVRPHTTSVSTTDKEVQIEWKDLHSNNNDAIFIGDIFTITDNKKDQTN